MRIHAAGGVAVLALLYAARRYYRNWGTTKGECAIALPGDELVGSPAERTTEAIDIDAPTAVVWSCLQRMIDHPGRPSLSRGDVVRLMTLGLQRRGSGIALRVEQVIDGVAVVLRATPDSAWPVVMSFHLLPREEDNCRLLLRTRTPLRHPGQVFLIEVAGPVLAALTRALLSAIKRDAENAEPPAMSRTARDAPPNEEVIAH